MTDNIFVAVDPGVTGAIAFMESNRFTVFDLPVISKHKVVTKQGERKESKRNEIDAHRLFNSVCYTVFSLCDGVESTLGNKKGLCLIEKQWPRPKDGSIQAFSIGTSYGILKGVLQSANLEISEVTPTTWKKSYGLIGEDKDMSRLKAVEIFPNTNLFSRKKDHNRAEALLMCLWLRRQYEEDPAGGWVMVK